MPQVTTLGILVADILGRPIDSIPERGKLSHVKEMTLHIGGCAANTAIGLHKLGVDTACIGKVGNDGFGDYVAKFLSDSGVDVRGVRRDAVATTSATMVLVGSDGERTFLHHIGANATLKPEDVDMGIVGAGAILHIAGAFLMPGFDGEPAAKVLKAAKERGVTTSLDTAWDATGQWMKVLEPMLQHVDYFVPSYEEARLLTAREDPRDVAKALRDYGIGIVCLKMGGDGALCLSDEGEIRMPIFRVDPVDATGAGDAFAAGFLCGVVQGWDLERTVQLANAVGALCVTAMGTTAGLRSLEGTMEFIETRTKGG